MLVRKETIVSIYLEEALFWVIILPNVNAKKYKIFKHYQIILYKILHLSLGHTLLVVSHIIKGCYEAQIKNMKVLSLHVINYYKRYYNNLWVTMFT